MSIEGSHSGDNYKAEIERIDEVTLSAKLSVNSDYFGSKYKSQLTIAQNQANLKGFRKGKAPTAMVEKLYKSNILKQLSDELMQEVTLDLIKTKEVQVVGYPEVDIKVLELGKDFEFEIKISLYPNPEIKDYESFDIKVVKAEITKDAIKQEIELILESKANEVECNDEALTEEHEFEGLVRVSVGEEADEKLNFEPLKSSLKINDTLPKEFLELIKGLKAPSEVSKAIDVPEDFKNTSLAGKKCFYEFQLKKVIKKELPKLTDEFVKNLESHDADNVKDLEKLIGEIKEEEESKRADEQVYDKILEQLVEKNKFIVPQPMIDEEIKNMFASYGFFQNSQFDANNFNVAPFRDNFNPQAEKRIQTSIAIDAIVESEKN
jgi:trigger factor